MTNAPAVQVGRRASPDSAVPPSHLLFTAPKGGVLRNSNFRPLFFDPAADKAGLPGLTPHELRHTRPALAIAARANVKVAQQMLEHASTASTLDIYAGLFADDLDIVADQLGRAFAKLNADQMRTKRCPNRPGHAALPFEKFGRSSRWLGQTASEPPIAIEPMTYALRASPVHDGGRWLVWCDAGLCPTVRAR